MLALLVALASRAWATEPRDTEATIVVSGGGAAAPFGMSFVEGRLRHRGKSYLLILRGAPSSTESVGTVRGLLAPRDIAGSYAPADGVLRNDRGVSIVFDPPLALGSGKLEIEIASRVRPKASTGQRGTVD